MYVRCGYLEGHVAPENREHFDRVLTGDLLAMLKELPGIHTARILLGRQHEENAPPFYATIELTFPSKEATEAALKSELREKIRHQFAEILPMLSGRIFHINHEAVA
ncbi:hypothetical protein AB4Y85_19265 [Microvirga sp. 2YAF29]|uniref:hypothetical protein n=1 Tax=Microvirga sp. 2YAF29 TaxID=3233031 RepID=UPI003F97B69C